MSTNTSQSQHVHKYLDKIVLDAKIHNVVQNAFISLESKHPWYTKFAYTKS